MKLFNLIKQALVTQNTDDSEKIPVMQVTYLDKVANVAQYQPYGLTSKAPEGESLAVLLSLQGQEQNRIAMPFAPLLRKKNLKDGETVLENMLAGSFLYLDEAGNLIIDIPNAITAQAASVTINAATINITGNVNITGTLTVNGVNVGETHTHPAGVPPGNTGQVNP